MVGAYHRRSAKTYLSTPITCRVMLPLISHKDLNINAKLPDARRSTRTKGNVYDLTREPYMTWTNRKAVTSA